jgi:hypothetical protein
MSLTLPDVIAPSMVIITLGASALALWRGVVRRDSDRAAVVAFLWFVLLSAAAVCIWKVLP